MELADFISLGQREPALPFLVIGGYAVGAHGHTRSTFDVDFLVRRLDREGWFERLSGAGMRVFGQATAFAQFTQPDEGDGLDLMFVDDRTFQPMWQASEERELARQEHACLAWIICWH